MEKRQVFMEWTGNECNITMSLYDWKAEIEEIAGHYEMDVYSQTGTFLDEMARIIKASFHENDLSFEWGSKKASRAMKDIHTVTMDRVMAGIVWHDIATDDVIIEHINR